MHIQYIHSLKFNICWNFIRNKIFEYEYIHYIVEKRKSQEKYLKIIVRKVSNFAMKKNNK